VLHVPPTHVLAEKLDMTNMQNEQGQYDGTFAYARDKRRQVAMAERFAELWGSQGKPAGQLHGGSLQIFLFTSRSPLSPLWVNRERGVAPC
jgi:hypothetical protein